MKDKIVVFGYATLFIGIALLAFTFASAYVFLSSNLTIAGTPDLVTVFGAALAPLIETCIRVMYLGVMGWIGSILTIRGVQLSTQLRHGVKPEMLVNTKSMDLEKLDRPVIGRTKTKQGSKTGKIKKTKAIKGSS